MLYHVHAEERSVTSRRFSLVNNVNLDCQILLKLSITLAEYSSLWLNLHLSFQDHELYIGLMFHRCSEFALAWQLSLSNFESRLIIKLQFSRLFVLEFFKRETLPGRNKQKKLRGIFTFKCFARNTYQWQTFVLPFHVPSELLFLSFQVPLICRQKLLFRFSARLVLTPGKWIWESKIRMSLHFLKKKNLVFCY